MVVWSPNDLEPNNGAVVTSKIRAGDVALAPGHKNHG